MVVARFMRGWNERAAARGLAQPTDLTASPVPHGSAMPVITRFMPRGNEPRVSAGVAKTWPRGPQRKHFRSTFNSRPITAMDGTDSQCHKSTSGEITPEQSAISGRPY